MCAASLSLLGFLLPLRSLKPEGLLHMASLNSQPSPSSMKLSFFIEMEGLVFWHDCDKTPYLHEH